MIVVTGACGFIGSNLVRYLHNMGEEVLAVDYVQRDYNLDLGIGFVDANDFINNLSLIDIDAIYHEGAISSTTETDFDKLLKYNIEYTMKLVKYCSDCNIPIQYASSASVYGNPTRDEWDNPNKSMNPLNKYASSKMICDIYAGFMLDFTFSRLQGMRYFNVYGPNEDHKGNQSSPHHKFRKQLEETGKIKLFEGSKEFLRDFVSVEEVIRLKVEYMNSKPSGIYDIGTGKPKSFYDVAVEIGGSEDVIEWVPMPDNLKEHYQKYTCAIMS